MIFWLSMLSGVVGFRAIISLILGIRDFWRENRIERLFITPQARVQYRHLLATNLGACIFVNGIQIALSGLVLFSLGRQGLVP